MNDEDPKERVYDPSEMTEAELNELRQRCGYDSNIGIRQQYWSLVHKDFEPETAEKLLTENSESLDNYLRSIRITPDMPKSLVKRKMELEQADWEEEQRSHLNDPNPPA
ncbi:MAG: hypothetical protein AAFR51_03910 [Pseudomonadota bacterium]